MIKEIPLPPDTCALGDVFLPTCNDLRVIPILRKGNQGMQMIGHQQPEMHMPVATFLPEIQRLPDDGGDRIMTKLVFSARRAVNRDKENSSIPDPRRNAMGQLPPDRVIFGRLIHILDRRRAQRSRPTIGKPASSTA